ncbi:hypothetical protein C2E23DRAFT_805881, partial [Lenzites betulinus]
MDPGRAQARVQHRQLALQAVVCTGPTPACTVPIRSCSRRTAAAAGRSCWAPGRWSRTASCSSRRRP